jgi:RNA-directed DNA polymerase
MSACRQAPHGADNVRTRPRALAGQVTPDQDGRVDRLDDRVWRAELRWEAGRHVTAHTGAPGGDGQGLDEMVETTPAEPLIATLHQALCEPCDQWAPGRLVERPRPPGGARPWGIATVADRLVQTAMPPVRAPSVAADFHEGSDGSRPTRDAQPAAGRFARTGRTGPGGAWRSPARPTSPAFRPGSSGRCSRNGVRTGGCCS